MTNGVVEAVMKLRGILAAGALVMAATAAATPATADWNGANVGAYSGFIVAGTTVIAQSGLQFGYSFGNGPVVVGIQTRLGLVASAGPTFLGAAHISGRLGFALGARGLVYTTASAGIFYVPGAMVPNFSAGAGFELKLGTGNLSLFAESQVYLQAVSGGCCAPFLQAGFNWRP